MGHSHGHDHSHHGHHHGFEEIREGNKKGLLIALLITTGIMLLEFFGGLLTNSLALLSDAGHMLSDASSLFLSFLAIWFASRPPSANKTYGYYRFEILAALFNGVTLFIIAFFIIMEAIQRFSQPPTVASGTMMVIAVIGLLANMISAIALLRKGDVENNVNLRSAYLHILGDALGSVGAIIAGFFMLFFDWYVADPIISVVVALLILKSGWGVIKNSIHILMEGTPSTISQADVKRELEGMAGVIDVHDLHIWTITSGLDTLSCHLLIDDKSNSQEILQLAIDRLKEKFNIDHTTIQIEKAQIQHDDMNV
ncbi:cation transporter [Cytobacillus oceanisediminis]|uniref:cation diffusion facilitator family transporter n=1 Tax=Cytobacillus oceanisediminis TaxID=665099 RepID=UPI0003329C1C|nr:cation diffusion facilitator family transporter [Cytobacillus oceanisediminis]EOR21711.1 cation diffusion facilitator family transporter [Niallia nealsonii AAU1]MBQ6448052.1 cation transporter [Bacillus sp. (in: firmicutes)]MBZ9534389.1 cation transporter [Cytobacillus oceanisediminis]MDU1845207.1 cation diffusion facilitator family transporter [Niallia nealsonii]